MAVSREYQARIDRVRERAPIDAVIRKAIKLGAGSKPRGKCPFHGSKSDSFSVDPKRGSARCWGCGWHGDVLRFVQDHYGLPFREALERLESEHGLDGVAAAPIAREKLAAEDRPGRRGSQGGRGRVERPRVESAVMGRWLWDHAGRDMAPVRRYLTARGVPAALLDDRRLADVRFMAQAPIIAWEEGEDPRKLPCAPAMIALIRRAPVPGEVAGGAGTDWQPMGTPTGEDSAEGGASRAAPRVWQPIGVHVTWLNPAFDDKMVRQRADGSLYPARKMLGGSAGGALVLPGDGSVPFREAELFVGEGLETVLSGMALRDAPPSAIGLALLSLDNLQGPIGKIAGAWPLYDPSPETPGSGEPPAPRRGPVAFPHNGPVTVLVDADMKPLEGPLDRRTGQRRGERVIEVRRGPIVHRAITGAERAAVCGVLAVKAWRAAGCRHVQAVRPPMGQDFNDRIREMEHV